MNVSSSSASSSSSALFSPAQPSRKARRRGHAADILASVRWRETVLRVPCGVMEACLVLDQLALTMEEVLACLMRVELTRVRGQMVVLLQTDAEGFSSAQLSGCLCRKIQSLFSGKHLRTRAGNSWCWWVMRTQTGGTGATEGLGGIVVMATVVEKEGAGGIFSR